MFTFINEWPFIKSAEEIDNGIMVWKMYRPIDLGQASRSQGKHSNSTIFGGGEKASIYVGSTYLFGLVQNLYPM